MGIIYIFAHLLVEMNVTGMNILPNASFPLSREPRRVRRVQDLKSPKRDGVSLFI